MEFNKQKYTNILVSYLKRR